MTTLEILAFILFIVVIVTAISERINIPYPLLLVITGLIVGFVPGIPSWHPPNDIVLALFLPPILFSAARLISVREIIAHLGTISWLSVVLVLVTTIAIALTLDFFIPAIPLSSAMVLGAIISPTDTTAACAILSNMNVRQHIIRTIEIESLFNDATGIVLYKTGVAFVALGSIKVADSALQTVWVGLGGIAVGLIVAFAARFIIEKFLTHSENKLPIIMSLILAYVAYLLADRLGLSSVLAVVAAGLYHRNTEIAIEASTRLSEKTVWDTLIFFLNGLIFITIGIQFPSFLKRVSYIPTEDLVAFSIITIVVVLLLRMVWVATTAYGVRLFAYLRGKPPTEERFSYKKIIIVSWSGMRGLVSLALAIAIPITLPNGDSFPFRDLIIFLTIIVILFTLLAQGLSLPFIIKLLGASKDDRLLRKQTEEIYQQLTKKAIERVKRVTEQEQSSSPAARKLVEHYYENRLLEFSVKYETDVESHEIRHEAEILLAKILEYERNVINKLRKQGEISEEIYIKILTKLDRDEVGFASYK